MSEDEREEFLAFLRRAAAKVATWPEWKRKLAEKIFAPPVPEEDD